VPDPIEDRLAGLDAPRRLPAGLRQRLEHSLLEGEGAGHRPLGPDLAERLEGALADPVASAMAGVDAPRPLEPELRLQLEHALQPRPRRSRVPLAAAAVLAVLAGAGLAVGLSGSSTPSPQRALTHSGPGTQKGTVSGGVAGPSGATGGGTPISNVQPAPGTPESAGANAAAGSSASPLPTVTGVTPDSGPTTGGTWVTITGSGFSQVRSVSFGGVPAAEFVAMSPGSVRALAPAHAAGTVDVQVTIPGGTSPASPQDRYSFS